MFPSLGFFFFFFSKKGLRAEDVELSVVGSEERCTVPTLHLRKKHGRFLRCFLKKKMNFLK